MYCGTEIFIKRTRSLRCLTDSIYVIFIIVIQCLTTIVFLFYLIVPSFFTSTFCYVNVIANDRAFSCASISLLALIRHSPSGFCCRFSWNVCTSIKIQKGHERRKYQKHRRHFSRVKIAKTTISHGTQSPWVFS